MLSISPVNVSSMRFVTFLPRDELFSSVHEFMHRVQIKANSKLITECFIVINLNVIWQRYYLIHLSQYIV